MWRVGMEAVCINEGGWVSAIDGRPVSRGPEKGDVFTVAQVKREPIRTRYFWQRWFGEKHVWLSFRAYPNRSFCASSFRPAQKTSSEIVARIKACRPAKRKAEV